MSRQARSNTIAESFQSGAYQRWMGVYLIRTRDKTVEVLVPYRDEFDDGFGRIQRAVIAALADIAGAAAFQLLDEPPPAVTGLHLEYRANALSGNELYAQAWVVNWRAYVEIRTNDDRAIVARATVLTNQPTTTPPPNDRHVVIQPHYPV